jgi:hypothetical protein
MSKNYTSGQGVSKFNKITMTTLWTLHRAKWEQISDLSTRQKENKYPVQSNNDLSTRQKRSSLIDQYKQQHKKPVLHLQTVQQLCLLIMITSTFYRNTCIDEVISIVNASS